MDLNKYIVTPDSGKPFHSSAYAQIAHPGHVGSVGTTSFNQRLQVEKSRQVVGSYARSHMHCAPRQPQNPAATFNRDAGNGGNNSQTRAPLPLRPAPERAVFREPPTRPHNPFG